MKLEERHFQDADINIEKTCAEEYARPDTIPGVEDVEENDKNAGRVLLIERQCLPHVHHVSKMVIIESEEES